MGGGNELVSVGIDVGTTTTHLTISKLALSNRSLLNEAPRLAISGRKIVYQSQIHMTPLAEAGEIDAEAVAGLVRREYELAGVGRSDIQSGAAIITGETARLRNAPAVVESISELAGDFVVASAGPHLEGLLAGRGAGAAQASSESGRTICNIDVGGGTANFSVFAGGEAIDTACLGIGGRFLKLAADGRVTAITDAGEVFLDAVAKSVKCGDRLSEEQLGLFADLLSETILLAALRKRPPQVTARLLTTEPLRHDYDIDEIWFSGGVAEFMRLIDAGETLPALTAYGDMGGHLAASLLAGLGERQTRFRIAENPIRATVIGAGLHSLQLSGSTVSAHRESLPLRNIPLLRPFAGGGFSPEPLSDLPESIRAAVERCLNNHDLDWRAQPLALALAPLARIDYAGLRAWSHGLAAAYRLMNAAPPLVLVSAQDLGMALGQLLREHLSDERLIVVDGIGVSDGDYIDIGRPVAGGQALPVVVKTLAFASD